MDGHTTHVLAPCRPIVLMFVRGTAGICLNVVFRCVSECLIAPPRYPDIVAASTHPLPLPPVYPSSALPRPYPLFAPSRSAIQLLTGGVATETSTGKKALLPFSLASISLTWLALKNTTFNVCTHPQRKNKQAGRRLGWRPS